MKFIICFIILFFNLLFAKEVKDIAKDQFERKTELKTLFLKKPWDILEFKTIIEGNEHLVLLTEEKLLEGLYSESDEGFLYFIRDGEENFASATSYKIKISQIKYLEEKFSQKDFHLAIFIPETSKMDKKSYYLGYFPINNSHKK